MAGFAEMLQRLARDLEQADAQRPEDDLRARMGYGPAEDVEDVDDVDDADGGAASESIWGPSAEAARKPEAVEEADAGWEPGPAREREPATRWKPAPERTPAPPVSRTPGTPYRAPEATYRAPPPSAPASSPPRPSSESLLPERVRARLRGQDALREAFVMKELLDRPLGLRRGR